MMMSLTGTQDFHGDLSSRFYYSSPQNLQNAVKQRGSLRRESLEKDKVNVPPATSEKKAAHKVLQPLAVLSSCLAVCLHAIPLLVSVSVSGIACLPCCCLLGSLYLHNLGAI